DPGEATIVILLAERDPYAAELLEYFLRIEGYEGCATFDPPIAEQLFSKRRPELSIVDLMISGGGLDLCRRLARDGTAPVLAIGAVDLCHAALDLGASSILHTPL